MNRVVVLCLEAEFSSTLCAELRPQLNCVIIPTTDPHRILQEAPTFPHQCIILDTDTLTESLRHALVSLLRKTPMAGVIAFSGSREVADTDCLYALGVQEILSRPLDKSQIKQSAIHIADHVRLIDRAEIVHLRLTEKMKAGKIVVKSRSMLEILECLPRLADSNATILIEGETGTGKDLLARAIHYLGPRSGGPFVTVDCGAIPDTLIENELFGHCRGAYTGASGNWSGLVHEANGGTIYLDEIESLPLQMQTRFLHLLQTGEYRPLGQTAYQSVNARVIASSNTALADVVQRREFRRDLFHRLNVIHMSIPPLRERKADISALVMHFVRTLSRDLELSHPLREETLEEWTRCPWPGNVRELENRVQEWLIKETPEFISHEMPLSTGLTAHVMTLSGIRNEALDRSERSYLKQVLRLTNGNISQAARLANVDRKNLSLLLRKRGIDPEEFRRR